MKISGVTEQSAKNFYHKVVFVAPESSIAIGEETVSVTQTTDSKTAVENRFCKACETRHQTNHKNQQKAKTNRQKINIDDDITPFRGKLLFFIRQRNDVAIAVSMKKTFVKKTDGCARHLMMNLTIMKGTCHYPLVRLLAYLKITTPKCKRFYNRIHLQKKLMNGNSEEFALCSD